MWGGWFRRRRRRRLIAQPLADDARSILRRRVRHYPYLPPDQQQRVDDVVQVLLAEKHWVGAGVALTDEMRLTIAGYAGVLASGFAEPYYFDRLQSIVVRPRAFRYVDRSASDNPYLTHETRIGEAWHHGPVILAWRAVERSVTSTQNVALHEFAHHLDGLVGEMDGKPYFETAEMRRRWEEVSEAEFLQLVGQAQRGEPTLLDPYGAVSRAEFFAVTTECFFQQPHELRSRHPELYAVFAEFYRQQPHAWAPLRSDQQSSLAEAGFAASAANAPRRKRRMSPVHRLGVYQSMQPADALFTMAQDCLDDGDFEGAMRILNRLLEAHPDDGEAYAQRAVANFALGRGDAARDDCRRALELDDRDVDALLTLGTLEASEGRLDTALEHLSLALSESPRAIEPRFRRAEVYLEAGKIRRAVGDLTTLLGIDPFDVAALRLRAQAYQRLGKMRRADADLRKAQLLDPPPRAMP
ncbi:MAG: zinc-dependent peptidase [Planctomycetales bacterium]|nr:zinc-dependent peptidase [Planctomycetales bacterium]